MVRCISAWDWPRAAKHQSETEREREDRRQQDAQAKAAKCQSETEREKRGGKKMLSQGKGKFINVCTLMVYHYHMLSFN